MRLFRRKRTGRGAGSFSADGAAVLQWGHARDAAENFGEIIGRVEAQLLRYLRYVVISLAQQLFRAVYFQKRIILHDAAPRFALFYEITLFEERRALFFCRGAV